jgi:hypothetical protein
MAKPASKETDSKPKQQAHGSLPLKKEAFQLSNSSTSSHKDVGNETKDTTVPRKESQPPANPPSDSPSPRFKKAETDPAPMAVPPQLLGFEETPKPIESLQDPPLMTMECACVSEHSSD